MGHACSNYLYLLFTAVTYQFGSQRQTLVAPDKTARSSHRFPAASVGRSGRRQEDRSLEHLTDGKKALRVCFLSERGCKIGCILFHAPQIIITCW